MTPLRRAVVFAGAGLALTPAAAYLADPFGGPRYEGPVSDHFDGEQFHNPGNVPAKGFADLLKWQMSAERKPWPEWIDTPPGPPPPREVRRPDLRVTLVSHATTLLQMEGCNVLTDPVWSDRASPVAWAGPRRHRPPGIRFEDLPPIHAVLVSHNHYDHLDIPTLQRLHERHRPRFITTLGNGALLAQNGIEPAAEMDWWENVSVQGVRVTCVPAQHFSGRGFRDRNATLWCGFVLEGSAGTVYFAGDTGFGPHFEAIRARFSAIRLALLPIGAFEPRWFMQPVHMAPDEALRAHQALGAAASVAIHFGTFAMADDGPDDAPEQLRAALAAVNPPPRFWILDNGGGRDV